MFKKVGCITYVGDGMGPITKKPPQAGTRTGGAIDFGSFILHLPDNGLIPEVRENFARHPIVYAIAPVDLFPQSLSSAIPGQDTPYGIGRNYDGYRVYWVEKDGYNVATNYYPEDLLERQTGLSPGAKTDGFVIKSAVTVPTKKDRIARFKRDLVEAAATRSDVRAFLEAHREAMGLELPK